ncbi:assembly of actin patch protein [Knufia fluminis]|uniref:Assembly of actin patch protein n=1 Tax=Knufia fluminis TaxID=191047 RepID=A0AAN8I8W3_9EURO|nr:assembly of actin patch protein [Knufia fluminis]
MPVPFKVKAVYEYRSEEPDDLIFDNGQIITVTEDDDADWYTGEYTNAQGQTVEGIFPRNFVEKYEPAIPTRPARAPRKAPQPEPVPEPQPEPEPEAPAEPPAKSAPETAVPAAAPPPAHEPSKEAEVDPPKEFSEPTPAPAPAPKAEPQPQPPPPAAAESKPPAAKKPPPVVEKPSSFRDRIAAFNKPAAAPVAPFKPPGSGGTGFIKKPFVAPPPSRNAYVPPPRDPPPPKAYRREEEVERERAEPEPVSESRPPITSETTTPEEDQPKPTSLKDRIALLQQQQQEAAQRQAESAKKKEKPKRPSKPARTESHEPPLGETDDSAHLERVSTEKTRREPEVHEDEPSVHRSTDDHGAAPTPPLPSRELVSDTNDADDSGAADTEDPHDISTEEERPRPRSIKSPPVAAAKPEPVAEEDQDEEDTEEDEDPEIRRKRELRERMAKMSGGMGMMGMFGAGASSAPKRSKSTREEKQPEPSYEEEEARRAPPVPIMALPGMSNKTMPKPAQAPESDDEDGTAQPTPQALQEAELAQDDYISQRPSRKSTERSQPLSPQDRAPPPLPEDRPEPPQSPGARPVPPPPPPTRHDTHPSQFQSRDDSDEEEIQSASPSSAPKLPGGLPPAPTRAVPPPPPVRTESYDNAPQTAPPVPMSPISPQSRAPPPPPPGQAPPRRTTTQSSLQPPAQEDSEEEVTEYEGDYDTDIASDAKHKTALKSHQRDSSIEYGTLSDDGAKETISPQARAVPPPIPTNAPRDVPPPPPQAATRPRESMELPRAAPPPVPPPQTAPRPRESVDSPRAAPPPLPPTQSPVSPIREDDYDPYRYSAGPHPGLPAMAAALRRPTEEFDDDYNQPSQIQQAPERAAPPPPAPTDRAVPPPPTAAPPVYHEPDPMSMSGGLSAPKKSVEIGRSNTTSRRSADVPRPSADQGFIAADVDLAQGSMWWTQDNNPPPSLQHRNDVLWEMESSTTQKRGGRASISRDVYVLYQDYSQTTINATYDASEPSHVAFEQNHERPPMPPRKDQLENAFETFGMQIAKTAEKALGTTIGEGTAQEFVLALIRSMPLALNPVGTRAYGALVYANLANASTQQFDEIRAGDIITFRGAKFAGHKGGLHQKYSQDVPQHVAVVIDWDGTKKKIRAWEQGNQEKGKRAKVREESYRVADLKSGEVRVWRVMPRSYVNWGTA